MVPVELTRNHFVFEIFPFTLARAQVVTSFCGNRKLNKILADADIDRSVEALAKPYYAEKMGRPSLPPGIYVRMLLVEA